MFACRTLCAGAIRRAASRMSRPMSESVPLPLGSQSISSIAMQPIGMQRKQVTSSLFGDMSPWTQGTRMTSVLRKRKAKMNKHKHRKRLKKLRNKTKHGKRK